MTEVPGEGIPYREEEASLAVETGPLTVVTVRAVCEVDPVD